MDGYKDADGYGKIKQELVADLVGDYLFTDPDFIGLLSTENRSLFQKLFDEVKYLCQVATAGSKEGRQLEKVKKAFEDAYRQDAKNTANDGGVRYSISEKDSQLGRATAEFIQDVNQMVDAAKKSKRKLRIGEISKNHAAQINSLMQTIFPEFSADGYEVWIDGTGASHIENRHGVNGAADHSMASLEAKMLIPWAAQNAESSQFITNENGTIKLSGSFLNSDGTRAPEIMLKKQLDQDTVCMSECIPDSAAKRIWITSAYIKKGNNGQKLNMEEKSSLQPTPEAEFDGTATTSIIRGRDANVNKKLSLSGQEELGPVWGGIYGRDVALEELGATIREDIQQQTAGNQTEAGQKPDKSKKIKMIITYLEIKRESL